MSTDTLAATGTLIRFNLRRDRVRTPIWLAALALVQLSGPATYVAQFPTAETMKRLSRIALDPGAPQPVREQAIRTLGARQIRGLHPALQWSAEAVQLADEALIRIAGDATVRGKVASEELPHALRHVASDGSATSPGSARTRAGRRGRAA